MLQSQVDVGAIAWHSKITPFVFPSDGSNGVNKHLIPFVHDFVLPATICEIVSMPPFPIVYLVHRLEHEEFAFFLESPGYLCPHGVQLVFYSLIDGFILCGSFHIQPMLAIGSVMMNVDDGIQPAASA